jgi:hypothetical protein
VSRRAFQGVFSAEFGRKAQFSLNSLKRPTGQRLIYMHETFKNSQTRGMVPHPYPYQQPEGGFAPWRETAAHSKAQGIEAEIPQARRGRGTAKFTDQIF